MSWNYRIVEACEFDYSIFTVREVYYNDDGSIKSISETGITPYGETKGELREDINLMLKAFDKPVLRELD